MFQLILMLEFNQQRISNMWKQNDGLSTPGMFLYAMVAGIPHDIPFDMCHVVCKGIPHDYCFGHVVSFFGHVVSFSKPQKTLI